VKPAAVPPGLLPLAKPSGPTSRSLVDRVVRVLRSRRVGHAGTLDPFASGLLLVAWGRATALVPYLHGYEKRYRATVRFGRVTDTQDRTGVVLEEHEASALDRERVERALAPFRGRILQVPPMYSAVKQGGRRLYEIARDGRDVEREAREREVSRLELLDWDPPVAVIEVACSTGTYVRTLAHDLGRALGPGASLDALVRTGIGPFRLTDALDADRLDSLSREELLERAVAPADALPDWPALRLPDDEARLAAHGSFPDPGRRAAAVGRYRLLDERGALLALAEGGVPPRLLRVLAGE
jgi:tRNA pseudouridine55 synthase